MSRPSPLTLIALVTLLAACGGDDDPVALTRVSAEPAGARCAHGGLAVATGADDDHDGVLDDAEVAAVDYRCHDQAAIVVRVDAEAAGDRCPAGGHAVRTGRDIDRDGSLGDAEIESTSYACDPATTWIGDLRVRVAADGTLDPDIGELRIVTGALTLSGEGDVALPALEIVAGGLQVGDRLDEVELPALATVGGLGLYQGRVSLPTLTVVGGNAVIGDGVGLTAVDAPALRSIAGDLAVRGSKLTALALPALAHVGGDVDVRLFGSQLATLEVDALTAIGGSLHVELASVLTALDLPAVETVGGRIDIGSSDGLSEVTLPALREVGADVLVEGRALVSVDLGALATTPGSVRITGDRLQRVDLGSIAYAIGVQVVGNVGPLGVWQPGTIDQLDLGSLISANGLTLCGFDAMTALELPRLRHVADQLFLEGLGDIETISAPALETATKIWVQHGSSLRSVVFGRGAVRGVSNLSLIDVAPLDGDSVVPSVVRATWLAGSGAVDLRVLATLHSTSNLRIQHNDDLVALTGLYPGLEIGSLDVEHNQQLASLDGLDPLRAVGGHVSIVGNDELVDLAGLGGVTVIGGDVSIGSNAKLVDLRGLRLGAIGGGLAVTYNDSLASLDGLDDLTHVTGAVDISDNPRLPASDIAALRARLVASAP